MIVFDYPNGVGETRYFEVIANGAIPTTSFGIALIGVGMSFDAQSGNVYWDDIDTFQVTNVGGFNVFAGTPDGTITLSAPGTSGANGLTLVGATVISLSTVGNHFGINDHTTAQIFAVFEDGTSNIGNAIGGSIDGGSP